MTDQPNPENTTEPASSWEAQLDEAAKDQAPARRDGFDAARKKTFLKALSKGHSLTAAAKAANVSPKTVYNHQRDDEHFRAACQAAIAVNAPAIELAAFERGVTGVEEEVISYGKHVGTRVKRSDAILQTLLKGSNPDKYGPHAGFKRRDVRRYGKKWLEKERKRLKKELRPELMAEFEAGDFGKKQHAESLRTIASRIDRIRQDKIARGFYWHAETDTLVPPGWTLVPIGSSHISCEDREP